MHALITGASRGIGAALVLEGRARGHTVTGTTRQGPDALEVTDAQAQARLAARVGPIDLLVCNAGVFADRGVAFEALTPQHLAESFEVNVTGVVMTVQAQLPNLSRGGRIAIISSQMGSQALAAGNGYAYRASKAAAISIAVNLAADLGARGIAVGVYHPGWVRTDMGGPGADVTPARSAHGLWDRFEGLTLETTGCFETWDGRSHPF